MSFNLLNTAGCPVQKKIKVNIVCIQWYSCVDYSSLCYLADETRRDVFLQHNKGHNPPNAIHF
jgi:hypothetical protein